jgi:hypothetical protein
MCDSLLIRYRVDITHHVCGYFASCRCKCIDRYTEDLRSRNWNTINLKCCQIKIRFTLHVHTTFKLGFPSVLDMHYFPLYPGVRVKTKLALLIMRKAKVKRPFVMIGEISFCEPTKIPALREEM